jgi:membrane protein YdbS with pleckstrin-like domain
VFERISRLVLRVLRTPHEPHPPLGGPGSLVVFRAGANYFKLRRWLWAVRQLTAAIALIFSVLLLNELRLAVAEGPEGGPRTAFVSRMPPLKVIVDVSARAPRWVFFGLWVLKAFAVASFFAQMFASYVLLRLDFEQRWYMVTDRSLRLRSGIWGVREMTMSFANVQQITLTQGPLQRLLGLADVCVESAGGGRATTPQEAKQPSLHRGVLHSVDNAEAVRDLIRERLRHFREAGLGDAPSRGAAGRVSSSAHSAGELAAAVAMRDEAAALRAAIARAETAV